MTNYKNKLLKMCIAAMFAALICVATILIQIPTPLGGYVNFGDCFILVGAWVLGPVYGFAAGAIGSAMADIFSGYLIYAPATFIIKGLIALIAALIAHSIVSKNSKLRIPGYCIGAATAEAFMIAGYYLYEATILGYGFTGALPGIAGNAVQAAVGAVCGCLIILLIAKTKVLAKFDRYTE